MQRRERVFGEPVDFYLAFKGLPDRDHPLYGDDEAIQRLCALKENIYFTLSNPSRIIRSGARLTLYDRLVPLEKKDLELAKNVSFQVGNVICQAIHVQVPESSPWNTVLPVVGSEQSSNVVELWSVDPDIPIEGLRIVAIKEKEFEDSDDPLSIGLVTEGELAQLMSHMMGLQYEDTK